MFGYCEPCPVKRKATLPAAPLPRWIPRPRSAGQAAGLPACSARSAISALTTSSSPWAKSIASRSGARSAAALGAAGSR